MPLPHAAVVVPAGGAERRSRAAFVAGRLRTCCAGRALCWLRPLGSPAARRGTRGARGGTKPSAYDARHDISLLTARFRSAAVNAKYEAARASDDASLWYAMHAVVVVAFAVHLGTAADGVAAADLGAGACAALGAMWAVRLVSLAAYAHGRAPRLVLELSTFVEALLRLALLSTLALPGAVARRDAGTELVFRLQVAAATSEVAALARYELALPTCAAVVGTQLVALALALADRALLEPGAVGAAASASGGSEPALRTRGEAAIAVLALLSLPTFLHLEVARRRAWLQGERLAALRQEVSHFGLNHLYHAATTIEQVTERWEDELEQRRRSEAEQHRRSEAEQAGRRPAADEAEPRRRSGEEPAARRRGSGVALPSLGQQGGAEAAGAQHTAALSRRSSSAWLPKALGVLGETLDEVTKLLRLIVDDDAPASEAVLTDFNLVRARAPDSSPGPLSRACACVHVRGRRARASALRARPSPCVRARVRARSARGPCARGP